MSLVSDLVAGSFGFVMETFADRPSALYRGRHRRSDTASIVLSAMSAATVVASGLTLISMSTTGPAPDVDSNESTRQASHLFPTTVSPPTQNAILPRPDWTAPSKAELSDTYGPRDWRGGEMHYGVDFAADQGVINVAAHDGTVTFAGTRPGYGQLVTIDNGDGIVSWYGHHSKLAVAEGDTVRTGDPIGLAGDTGDATGPHLHFEIRIDDKPVDPLPFFKKHDINP